MRARGRGRGAARGRRLPKVIFRSDSRPDAWDRLVAAAEALRDRAIVALLLYSGLRVAELTALDLEDWDPETERLHVRHGKGDKERWPEVHLTAITLLHEYLEVRAEPAIAGDRALFLSSQRRRICTRQVRRLVQAAGIRAGIGSWVHPHTLRHSHATRLYQTCGDLLKVARQLGHEDIETTQIYAHVADDALRAAVRQM